MREFHIHHFSRKTTFPLAFSSYKTRKLNPGVFWGFFLSNALSKTTQILQEMNA